jgi:uncharacterized protein YcbX
VEALIARSGPRAGKPYRGKEHDGLHLAESLEQAAALAAQRGVLVEAVRSHSDRYFDDAPISLIVDSWLDGLNAHVGYHVDPQRFRPNLLVESEAIFAMDEAALCGRDLRIGDVILHVRGSIERCVVISYDPRGGKSDERILRYVARERAATMGVYCDVPRAGTVRIGDSVELIER